MKNGMLTVFRKELARFFGDKRMAFTTVLLPGLMIFFLYSFMGTALANQFTVDEDYIPSIHAVDLPGSVAAMADAAGLEIISVTAEEIPAIKEALTAQETQLLAVFPGDFEQAVACYDPLQGEQAPQVALYYNSVSVESQTAYSALCALLEGYESALANRFDINGGGEEYDLATEEETAGNLFASLLPMLLTMLLFSGCMAVAPESIAGEKDRGTIATLLVTPLKRSHLALGKICALSVIALLSGASSTLGTLLSLPKLMQLDGEISVPYGPAHYLTLTAVILSTVLLIVTVISVISAFAKSAKEAQTYITPLMILVTLVGVTAMFGNGPQESLPMYLIPFYNSVQAMTSVFSFRLEGARILITVLSNLVYSGAGVFALTRMFHSERVMFRR